MCLRSPSIGTFRAPLKDKISYVHAYSRPDGGSSTETRRCVTLDQKRSRLGKLVLGPKVEYQDIDRRHTAISYVRTHTCVLDQTAAAACCNSLNDEWQRAVRLQLATLSRTLDKRNPSVSNDTQWDHSNRKGQFVTFFLKPSVER